MVSYIVLLNFILNLTNAMHVNQIPLPWNAIGIFRFTMKKPTLVIVFY